MTKQKKPTKPAQSFRLGERHRQKLEECADFSDESQVDILRTMIDIAHKAMMKKQKERELRRAEREAAA